MLDLVFVSAGIFLWELENKWVEGTRIWDKVLKKGPNRVCGS